MVYVYECNLVSNKVFKIIQIPLIKLLQIYILINDIIRLNVDHQSELIISIYNIIEEMYACLSTCETSKSNHL